MLHEQNRQREIRAQSRQQRNQRIRPAGGSYNAQRVKGGCVRRCRRFEQPLLRRAGAAIAAAVPALAHNFHLAHDGELPYRAGARESHSPRASRHGLFHYGEGASLQRANGYLEIFRLHRWRRPLQSASDFPT